MWRIFPMEMVFNAPRLNTRGVYVKRIRINVLDKQIRKKLRVINKRNGLRLRLILRAYSWKKKVIGIFIFTSRISQKCFRLLRIIIKYYNDRDNNFRRNE